MWPKQPYKNDLDKWYTWSWHPWYGFHHLVRDQAEGNHGFGISETEMQPDLQLSESNKLFWLGPEIADLRDFFDLGLLK